jgi:hypothetical protein
MEKHVTLVLALGLMIGTAAASHNSGSDTPAITDAGPDHAPDTAGNADTRPDTAEKPANNTGPMNRIQGITTAIANTPSAVADTVLNPIRNVSLGDTLGNVLDSLNPGLFLKQSVNGTGNDTANLTE